MTIQGLPDHGDQPDLRPCQHPPAPIVSGTNTLLLAYQSPPKPDVIALAAIVGNTGIVDILGSNGIGAFAVATTNVGGAGSITVRADLDSELRWRVGAKLPAQALVSLTERIGGLARR